nr:hypothetical protein CFP56_24343 [Quercus suber]
MRSTNTIVGPRRLPIRYSSSPLLSRTENLDSTAIKVPPMFLIDRGGALEITRYELSGRRYEVCTIRWALVEHIADRRMQEHYLVNHSSQRINEVRVAAIEIHRPTLAADAPHCKPEPLLYATADRCYYQRLDDLERALETVARRVAQPAAVAPAPTHPAPAQRVAAPASKLTLISPSTAQPRRTR